MKKLKKVLIFAAITALLTCLLCVALSAETISGTCGAEGDGSNLTWSLDTETGVLKIEGKGAMKDYLFGGAPWYNYCSGIKNAKIGSGVTTIGSYAFRYCSSLTSIEIPSSVTSIECNAFEGCSSLTSIEIPNSVTSIGGYAFCDCTNLTSIIIPDSVTSIEYFAFYNCSSLTSIEIPSSVTSIGNSAFSRCSLTSIEIPSGVTSIGGYAFYGCSSLTSINVDEANKSYKSMDGVLYTKDQKTLISYPAKKEGTAYTIPDSVTSIGDSAFSYCSSLTSIEIPDSVISIGDHAFFFCSSLTSIEIPSSVISIGNVAFCDCSSLTSITIPDGVTSIGDSVFSGCSSLTSIEIPNSVASIGADVFYGCSSLTSIMFGDNSQLTSIGDRAFSGCSSLTSIEIPDGVTSIGDSVFSGCSSLTSIEIPDGVTSIGNFAFSGCSSLTSIIIPDSVTSIGNSAFSGCRSLTSIEIPGSVTSIGNSAFRDCTNLTSIEIPNGMTSIRSSAFNGCSSLTSIEIPSSVISIGHWAFYYCSSLTSIEIPSGVTSIGRDAFYVCRSLTSIKIFSDIVEIYDSPYTIYSPATIYGYKGSTAEAYATKYGRKFVALRKIIASGTCGAEGGGSNLAWTLDDDGLLKIEGEGAMADYSSADAPWYSYCSDIKSIDIADGVTNIGSNAFFRCNKLSGIVIPDSVVTIRDSAFAYCASLTEVLIPSNTVNIAGAVFRGCNLLTAINVDEANPNYKSADGVLFTKDGKTLMNYPAGKRGVWYIMPTEVTSIGSYAFEMAGITNITIPNSVTNIGDHAFRNCGSLTGIEIPKSVVSIGDGAFGDCSKLNSIKLFSKTVEIYDSPDTLPSDTNIYGCKGSTAESYAEKYNRNFIDLCADKHSYKISKTVAPTCMHKGYTVYICTVCDESYTEYIDTIGHKLDDSLKCVMCGRQFSAPLIDYRIYIYDGETSSPIEGALVTLGYITKISDANGTVEFQLEGRNTTSLKIIADSYPEYSVETYYIPSSTDSDIIYLVSADSDITSAWCNGDNVLLANKQINNLAATLTTNIVVSGQSKANILRYEIISGDQVIATSNDGKFKIPNSRFKPNASVSVRMYTDGRAGHNVYERELKISVKSFTFSITDKFLNEWLGVDIDLSGGADFLQGVSIRLPSYSKKDPIKVSVGNTKAAISFGGTADFIKKDGSDIDDKTLEETLEDLWDDVKKQNDPSKWNTKGKKTNALDLSGALVFEYSEAGITSAYGEVRAGYELSYKWGKTFVFVFIPVYGEFSIGLNGNLIITDFGYDFENAKFLIPDLDLILKAEIAVKCGVGCAIASAGFYGSVGGEIKVGVNDFQGYFRYRLFGEMGLYAQLNLFFWKVIEYRLPLFSGEIYGPNGRIYAKRMLLTLSAYDNIIRSYLENRSDWKTGQNLSESGTVLQNSSYTFIKPRIVTSGDTTMMLFMDDDGSDGYNYQHIYYSLFNRKTNSWEAPIRVDNSEYADLEYDVYADDSGIYIAYTKAGNITAENQDDDENILSGTEIYAARYDFAEKRFVGHTNVSNNDSFDSNPHIVADAVVWINNAVNDVFMQNADNKLMISRRTESGWEAPSVISNSGASITSMDMGILDGNVYIALVRDTDCDLATDDDRQLEIIDTYGNVVHISTAENGNDGVRFVNENGKSVLMWYNAGNIWRLTSIDKSPESLLNDTNPDLTGSFKYVQISENTSAVLYTKNNVGGSTGNSIYAVYCVNGIWGQPVKLTEAKEAIYIDAFDSCVYNGKLLTGYLSTKVNITNSTIIRNSDFMSSLIEPKDDLTINGMRIIYSTLFSGDEISIDVGVTNLSWQALRNVIVQIRDESGAIAYEKNITLEAVLASGESDCISITVPKSKLDNSKTYSVYITTPDWTDCKTENNKADISLWYTDFSAEAKKNFAEKRQQIVYTVSNNGNIAGTGKLKIYTKKDDGEEILFEDKITLGHGKSLTGTIEIPDGFCTDGNSREIYVEVIPDVEEIYNFNNLKVLSISEYSRSKTENVSDGEDAVVSPMADEPYMIYDKHNGNGLSFAITENGWDFSEIKKPENVQYSYIDGKLSLDRAFLNTLAEGYNYFTLTYKQGERISELTLIVEIIDTTPEKASLSVDDITVRYDGNRVELSELSYETSSGGAISVRYYSNGTWNEGLPANVGKYTVELIIAEDTQNHYGETRAQFTLTIVKGTRAISMPTEIMKIDGRIYFGRALPTAGMADGTIHYGYSIQNDVETVKEWTESGMLPKVDTPMVYYVFAKISGGDNYEDAYSLGYAVEAHIHNYVVKYDETGHWLGCATCESEKDMAMHAFDNSCDTTCDTCGYTRNITHSYEQKHDEANHWDECKVCGDRQNVTAHTNTKNKHICDTCGRKLSDHDGGTATCSEKATCTICGEKYGDFAEHSFGEWKANAEGKRTKVCSACGKVANFMYGDLNYDGKVNAIDLTILRRYLARYSDKIDIAVADFNGDGKVNTLDLMLLRRFLVGYDSVLGK